MSFKEHQEESDKTIPAPVIRKIRRILLEWGRANYRNFPWRSPDKPWHALIAEVLLQRTKVSSVVKVYECFVETFPEPVDLANAPVEDIERLVYPLGLRWRAPLLKVLGQQLYESNGRIPRTIEELTSLSGVGTYVASAWLSFHGGRRSTIIDANVVRWLCRLVDQPMDGETRRKKWLIELAELFTPTRNYKEYNYAVLDFTMQICTTRPLCTQCPIGAKYCKFGRKQLMNQSVVSKSVEQVEDVAIERGV